VGGAASVLIGLLLIVVAYLLMRRNLALLIDEAAPADIRERLRRRLLAVPAIAGVEVTPVERAL
jgi:divalent metal cation (Fe/Co/Zn/Cd) transporter